MRPAPAADATAEPLPALAGIRSVRLSTPSGQAPDRRCAYSSDSVGGSAERALAAAGVGIGEGPLLQIRIRLLDPLSNRAQSPADCLASINVRLETSASATLAHHGQGAMPVQLATVTLWDHTAGLGTPEATFDTELGDALGLLVGNLAYAIALANGRDPRTDAVIEQLEKDRYGGGDPR